MAHIETNNPAKAKDALAFIRVIRIFVTFVFSIAGQPGPLEFTYCNLYLPIFNNEHL